jgi:hypothetical protein
MEIQVESIDSTKVKYCSFISVTNAGPKHLFREGWALSFDSSDKLPMYMKTEQA